MIVVDCKSNFLPALYSTTFRFSVLNSVFFLFTANPKFFPLFSESGFKTFRKWILATFWLVVGMSRLKQRKWLVAITRLNKRCTRMETWLQVLSFRGILSNWKLTKALRIVGSGNGLNDRWMATLLASLSGKLIAEELLDVSCART